MQSGEKIPESHLLAWRIAREEVMANVLRWVRLVVANYNAYTGQVVKEDRLFQVKLTDALWERIRNFLVSLSKLPCWIDKNLANTVFGQKQNADYWEKVFQTGKSPSNIQILAAGLDLNEMIATKLPSSGKNLMKLPHGQGVVGALRSVRVATKKTLKGLNQAAATRMARGDYAGAEALAGKGREIAQFQQQTNALLRAWRDVSSRGSKTGKAAKGEVTPLWGYYQPISQGDRRGWRRVLEVGHRGLARSGRLSSDSRQEPDVRWSRALESHDSPGAQASAGRGLDRE